MGVVAHDADPKSYGTASLEKTAGSLHERWCLSSDALEDVALLRQPCVESALQFQSPETASWVEVRHARTWDGGVIAVKQPVIDGQGLPSAEANGNAHGWQRLRFAVAHCGTPVVLPIGCRALPWHDDMQIFFISVWTILGRYTKRSQMQEYGHLCKTASSALETLSDCALQALERAKAAQQVTLQGKPAKVYFSVTIETLVVVPEIACNPGERPRQRSTWRRSGAAIRRSRSSLQDMDPGLVCSVDEVSFGGKLMGCVEQTPTGTIVATDVTSTNISSMLRQLRERVGSDPPLLQQVRTWMAELFGNPGIWNLLHASPSAPGSASYPNDDDGGELDVVVLSRLQIMAPSVEYPFQELCTSTGRALRRLVGLPEDSPQLQLDVHNVVFPNQSPPNSSINAGASPPLRNQSPPNSSINAGASPPTTQSTLDVTEKKGSPRRQAKHVSYTSQSSAPQCMVELNMLCYRWGFWTLAEDEGDGPLHLEPGTNVNVHLELPTESLRLSWQPDQFYVCLLPFSADPWGLRNLMEVSLLVLRLPGDLLSEFSQGLDVEVPVPAALENPHSPVRVALRLYAVRNGDLSAQNCDCVALGRPLECRIGGLPGPLAMLTTLSTNLVQWRLSSIGALPKSSCGPSQIWGAVQNQSLEPYCVVTCCAVDDYSLRHIMPQLALSSRSMLEHEREGSSRIPCPPEALEVDNASMGYDCLLADGAPVLVIDHQKGVESYRIECTRKVALGSGSLPNASPRSFVVLTTQVSTQEADHIDLKVDGLLPGRYVFRVQARMINGAAYGPLSLAPEFDCMLPDPSEQMVKLTEVSHAMTEGRQAGSTRNITRAIRAALRSGVNRDHSILNEACKVKTTMELQFRELPFQERHRMENARKKVQEQLRILYRPALEKALHEASEAGVDMDSDEMYLALCTLEDLQSDEEGLRRGAQKRLQACQKAENMLWDALQPPRHHATIEQALKNAGTAGVFPESPAMREARSALRSAAISEDVHSRAQQRRWRELAKREASSATDCPFEFKTAARTFLRCRDGSRRAKAGIMTPLLIAAETGNTEKVQMLLRARAEFHDFGGQDAMTALCLASKNAHCDVATLLLKAHCPVDQLDQHGNTPLMLCASDMKGHPIFRMLIKRRADVHHKNSSGKTPLHLTARYQQYRAVRMLLKQKADPEARDFDGNTPVMVARTTTLCVARTRILNYFEEAKRSSQRRLRLSPESMRITRRDSTDSSSPEKDTGELFPEMDLELITSFSRQQSPEFILESVAWSRQTSAESNASAVINNVSLPFGRARTHGSFSSSDTAAMLAVTLSWSRQHTPEEPDSSPNIHIVDTDQHSSETISCSRRQTPVAIRPPDSRRGSTTARRNSAKGGEMDVAKNEESSKLLSPTVPPASPRPTSAKAGPPKCSDRRGTAFPPAAPRPTTAKAGQSERRGATRSTLGNAASKSKSIAAESGSVRATLSIPSSLAVALAKIERPMTRPL